MKFEIGDTVLIDPNLEITNHSFNVAEPMLQYRGKTATVVAIVNYGRDCYKLSADDGYFNWDCDWLMSYAINKGRG